MDRNVAASDATTGNVTPVAGQVVTATSSSGVAYTGAAQPIIAAHLRFVRPMEHAPVTTGIPTGVVYSPR
ncbi:MAG: hypothetical protein R2867_06630 [Caldilineaceae bacterium]